jgi:2-alkenal reductase
MRLRAAAMLGLLGLALALALAGCGDKGSRFGSTLTRTVERTTRVEVVKQLGGGDGAGATTGFDPRAIYERESLGVVTVVSLFQGGASGGGVGQGSGFVISGDGEIATNAHVVTDGEGSSLQKAGQVYVQFGDRNQVEARIVGYDPNADVALLKIDGAGLELRPLPFAKLSEVHVGEPVAAIGSPFGEPQSLSVGVVSALDRSIQSLTGFDISGAIQTDAAINRGNSGGPLLDARGRVLGINSQIKTSSGEGSGVGFAVNADTVRRSLDQLRKDGTVHYAYLGVTTTSVYPQLAGHFGLAVDHGAWIQDVPSGGPAAQAGLRGGSGGRVPFQAGEYRTGGDVVVAVARHRVERDVDLGRLLAAYAPGQEVPLTIQRGGAQQVVTVRLGDRPAAKGP